MHQKYGESVDISEMSSEVSEDMVKKFSLITGLEEFGDKELLFINRTLPGIVGGLLLHVDGQ